MNFSSLGYLIKEGFKNVWSNRMMSIASIGVLISCLIMTGSALMLSVNVSAIVDSVGEKNETTVYLDDDMDEVSARHTVERPLRNLDNVAEVTFYSKEDAIQKFRDTVGEEVFVEMTGEDNPLPHAYKVAMKDLAKYDETVRQISALEGVQSVQSKSEVAEKLTSINTLVAMMSFWIILALAVISLFIISNTIRMTMFSHRFEISIMKSVGATNSFVRIPFVIEGVIIGLVSAGISVGALMLLYNGIIKAVQGILDDIIPWVPFMDVMWVIVGAFVAVGVVVGALGSMLSIRKFLKQEGNEILGW